MKRAAERCMLPAQECSDQRRTLVRDSADDLLLADGQFHEFPSERIDTVHTHGTGCTYSAAITAGLAKGESITEAVGKAKEFITRAIRTNPGLGRGAGPVNHHA